jgi:hypothetical protein
MLTEIVSFPIKGKTESKQSNQNRKIKINMPPDAQLCTVK